MELSIDFFGQGNAPPVVRKAAQDRSRVSVSPSLEDPGVQYGLTVDGNQWTSSRVPIHKYGQITAIVRFPEAPTDQGAFAECIPQLQERVVFDLRTGQVVKRVLYWAGYWQAKSGCARDICKYCGVENGEAGEKRDGGDCHACGM